MSEIAIFRHLSFGEPLVLVSKYARTSAIGYEQKVDDCRGRCGWSDPFCPSRLRGFAIRPCAPGGALFVLADQLCHSIQLSERAAVHDGTCHSCEWALVRSSRRNAAPCAPHRFGCAFDLSVGILAPPRTRLSKSDSINSKPLCNSS